MDTFKYIIGIDEAGRGPLAGPIAVGAVAATVNYKTQITNHKQNPNYKHLNGIRDSKKLSAKQREEWFEIISKNFTYKTAMVGPELIDRIGIAKATNLAVSRVLHKLLRFNLNSLNLDNFLVLLDGSLKAPKIYNQKTIIKGDEKIPIISAASIMAKVTRDKKMRRYHKKFPEYCFDQHKGYGTKLHYQCLQETGLCAIHRKSFLKNFLLTND